MGLCFDFPSCILSKMKKGFNASAKFPAVKEKSAAFTGSCLGGKLPRPSRAHPAVRRGPPAPALFICSHFYHFPVRSRLRDMGPAQPNKALSHPQKPGARAAEGLFFSGSAGGKLPRPSRAHPAVRRGPPAPALFVCGYFAISRSAAACATWGRRSQTRRFPIPKNQQRGPLRVRFSRVRRPLDACATWGRRSRLHLLGVCGMINTAQALGPRKGRGGAPCRERRGRYGT